MGCFHRKTIKKRLHSVPIFILRRVCYRWQFSVVSISIQYPSLHSRSMSARYRRVVRIPFLRNESVCVGKTKINKTFVDVTLGCDIQTVRSWWRPPEETAEDKSCPGRCERAGKTRVFQHENSNPKQEEKN